MFQIIIEQLTKVLITTIKLKNTNAFYKLKEKL